MWDVFVYARLKRLLVRGGLFGVQDAWGHQPRNEAADDVRRRFRRWEEQPPAPQAVGAAVGATLGESLEEALPATGPGTP